MSTQDELARTAERSGMPSPPRRTSWPNAMPPRSSPPFRVGRQTRARAGMADPAGRRGLRRRGHRRLGMASTNLDRTSSIATQPASPGSSICQRLPATGPATALPLFYVTTDVAARQIQLQVRRTSDCAITAVVSLPAGWLLTGGSRRPPTAAPSSRRRSASRAVRTGPSRRHLLRRAWTRFFRFAVNDQGRAGRLTVVGPPVSGLIGPIALRQQYPHRVQRRRRQLRGAREMTARAGKPQALPSASSTSPPGKSARGRLRDAPAPARPRSLPMRCPGWQTAARWQSATCGRPARPAPALHGSGRTRHEQPRRFAAGAQPRALERAAKCVFCVEEALISPDGKSLTATATQQTAHGYRNTLLRIALPSGRYRVLYESVGQTNSTFAFHPGRLGSARHRGVRLPGGLDQGRQAGPPGAPASALESFPGITHRLVIRHDHLTS